MNLKINNLIIQGIAFFLLIPMNTFGYDEPPDVLESKFDLDINDCRLQVVKDAHLKNCIINEFDGHDLIITIYDGTPEGAYKKANKLIISSWYQNAKISFEDLLGNGVKFIRIESEGNTGSGTLQEILSYWGWHGGKFVPVFFETKSYNIYDIYKEVLSTNFEFVDKGSKNISAVLKHKYSNNNPKHKAKYNWEENLKWREKYFSFYDQQEEQNKFARAGNNPVQDKIINARLNQIKVRNNMQVIDSALLNEIEIMQVLYDD